MMSAPLAIAFDVETSGLTLHPDAPLSKQPRMIEFGGVIFSLETGAIEEEISILVNPGIEISQEITGITGITNEDVADAPRFAAIEPQLRRAFGSCIGVVAHNLPFDKAIMKHELMRLNILDFPWPQNEMCTVGLHAEEWGRNPRLVELYEATFGRKLAQTHRALDDVKAMVEIIQEKELWQFLR